DIHFARIAQDGAEAALIGLDLIGVRPWIIVVAGNAGEAFLAKARYALVYRDGINHFYLAQEHSNLRERLAMPPNPLDGFVLREDHPYAYSLSAWREQVAQLRAAAATAEAGAQAARDWADARVREREQLHAEAIRKAEETVRQHHLGEEAAIRTFYEG